MKIRCHLVFAIFATILAAPWLIRASESFQTAAQGTKDAPYHQSDMSKSGSNSSASAGKHLEPVAAHNTYPKVPLLKIEILPSSISIEGPRYNQRLVIEGTFADGHQEDVTSQATITSSNSKVAIVDKDNYAVPQSDGQTTFTAIVSGRKANASLAVHDFSAATTWSFRNDVLPVMTKVGCNSGPCHGAAAGKNGFKLTLRGYDPRTDYFTLTHQALARRTERMAPAQSLILLKPTLTIPHGGGRRFPVGSPEYQIISGWIAQGMPAPQDSDARVTKIQVLPNEASLRPGAEQQLLVTAIFSDGHTEDVTRWTKFDSGDESVASVDANGHVTMHSFGEEPVTAWYQSHVAFARVRIPFPYQLEEAVFKKAPRHNYIDDAVLQHLQVLHIPPR